MMPPKNQRDKRGRRRGLQSRPKYESVKENLCPPTVGSGNHVKVLSENQPVLERCTHINIQVITSLWSTDVIGNSLKEALVADKNLFNRIQLCYNHLRKAPADIFNKFIFEMKRNEQKHVANLLEGSKKGQSPMSRKNYDRLKNVSPVLIRKIVNDFCEPAIVLHGSRESYDTDYAISEVEHEEIREETNSRQRNYLLIRTDYSFECLREALIKTRRDHLVKYMDEGWVIGTHVETTHPGSDEIPAKSFNEQLDLLDSEQIPSKEERPVREALKDLSNQNVPCTAAELWQSIMVYTYCRTPDDIRKYVKMFRSRQLHFIINDVFQRLFKMANPQSLETLRVKITIPENTKDIIETVTGISVADVGAENSLVTDASQEDAISRGKDYSAADVDFDKSLDAEILHDDNVNISNNNSSCDVNVNRPFGTDASTEDAVKTENAKPESTSDMLWHMPLPPLIDLVLTEPSATPFQNVGPTPNPNSTVAAMPQVCENKQKRNLVLRNSQPRKKVRKKEVVPFSNWTETSNARKNSSKKVNRHQLKFLKGQRQPKKPQIEQKLLYQPCPDMNKEKRALSRSLSLPTPCKANFQSEVSKKGLAPRNRRILSY